MLTNKEIYQALGAVIPRGLIESRPLKIVTDTREITVNSVFVALKGEKFDGQIFISQALELGAVLIIAENIPDNQLINANKIIVVENSLKAYQKLASIYRHKFSLPVIAVTGSNGKTSTKDILASALQESFCVLKNQANFNNEIGVPKTLLELKDIHQIAVVEMGMRGLGQIAELAAIAKPTIAIITTITPTHIELLGSLKNIAQAKAEVFKEFAASNLVVLNYDNIYTREMQPACQKIYFGFSEEADIAAIDIVADSKQTQFTCVDKVRNLDYQVRIPLLGRHNIAKTLAALAVASFLETDLTKVLLGLATCKLSSMRQSIEEYANNVLVINDAYNASPISMQMGLETLQSLSKQRRSIAVLGDMLELGTHAQTLHIQVGKYCLENKIDIVYTYGELAKLISDFLADKGIIVKHFLDKQLLAKDLKSCLQKDDVLLVKGSRGMKMEEIIEMIFDK